ncbi:MAG: hypothetical protein AAF367_06050 [Pseudomonadota bacterium]
MRMLSICLIMFASTADAASRIALHALSPDGSKAVITYDVEWIEVDLATGATDLILPTVTCSFTSAAYAPSGGDMALAAHCSVSIECAATRASLFTKPAGEPVRHVLTTEGRIWNNILWPRGLRGDDIIVRETRVSAPLATGLNDLDQYGGGCAQAPGSFIAIDPTDGRRTALDFLPRGWSAVDMIGAAGGEMIATLRARPTKNDHYTAEAEARSLCSDDHPDDWRKSICGPEGQDIRVRWQAGDWTLYDQAEATPLRRFASADLSVTADEYCTGKQIEGHVQTECRIIVNAPYGMREVVAPEGLFGDIALSADGTMLASLVIGRGLPYRRFDLFDLEAGTMTSLAHLLDAKPPWLGGRTP